MSPKPKKFKDVESATLLPQTRTVVSADLRFYPKLQDDGSFVYLPSVTTILSKAAPTHPQLIEWFKGMSQQAIDYVVNKASDEGSQVHQAIETFLKGYPVDMYCADPQTPEDFNTYQCYSMKVWEMISRFVSFYFTCKSIDPDFKVLFIEQKLASEELGYAGTCDLVVSLLGETWMIDHKTSNQLSDTYGQQTWAYKQLIESELGIKVDKRAILWLKAKTRTYKPDKLQGKGWQLVVHKDDVVDKMLWDSYTTIFGTKFNKEKPHSKSFPATFSLNEVYLGTDVEVSDDE
jgi:hypothetical protein